MKLITEFKEFAVKGNMIDMAVGIIIGTAFNKVIDVLAKQVLLPPLSLFSSGVNFQNKKLILRKGISNDTHEVLVSEVAVAYGELITVFIDFLIIGFTMFIVIKAMNRLRTKSEEPKNKAVATPKNIELLADLKQLMITQNELLKNNVKKH